MVLIVLTIMAQSLFDKEAGKEKDGPIPLNNSRGHTMSENKNNIKHLEEFIENAFDNKEFCKKNQSQLLKNIHQVLNLLTLGTLRVCEKTPTGWTVHQWIKKAILLYFQNTQIHPFGTLQEPLEKNQISGIRHLNYRDKCLIRDWNDGADHEEGIRVVPPASVRIGAYISSHVVLMPSFVNIGAFVGRSTMVDTWATVGSCAQIGERVHLSGGVGIGGVLEPLQASPVIIENDVFVGSRCVIVEGAHVEEGAVLGAGLVITASTPIIDVTTSTPQTLKKRIPKNSIVIPGMRSKKFPAGDYHLPCALIIGKRSESTDKKTSLTESLRQISHHK